MHSRKPDCKPDLWLWGSFQSIQRLQLRKANVWRLVPFLPAFLQSDLLAFHFHTDWLSWLGLSNQVDSTTDHLTNCYLPSTPKDRSTMKAELTRVIANRDNQPSYYVWLELKLVSFLSLNISKVMYRPGIKPSLLEKYGNILSKKYILWRI